VPKHVGRGVKTCAIQFVTGYFIGWAIPVHNKACHFTVCFLVLSLFNDAFSTAFLYSVEWENGDMERTQKETFMAYFDVLFPTSHGQNEKRYDNISWDRWPWGWKSNLGPTDYETRVITIRQRLSVSVSFSPLNVWLRVNGQDILEISMYQ
jgi:hypothetical protein